MGAAGDRLIGQGLVVQSADWTTAGHAASGAARSRVVGIMGVLPQYRERLRGGRPRPRRELGGCESVTTSRGRSLGSSILRRRKVRRASRSRTKRGRSSSSSAVNPFFEVDGGIARRLGPRWSGRSTVGHLEIVMKGGGDHPTSRVSCSSVRPWPW